jgi:transposase
MARDRRKASTESIGIARNRYANWSRELFNSVLARVAPAQKSPGSQSGDTSVHSLRRWNLRNLKNLLRQSRLRTFRRFHRFRQLRGTHRATYLASRGINGPLLADDPREAPCLDSHYPAGPSPWLYASRPLARPLRLRRVRRRLPRRSSACLKGGTLSKVSTTPHSCATGYKAVSWNSVGLRAFHPRIQIPVLAGSKTIGVTGLQPVGLYSEICRQIFNWIVQGASWRVCARDDCDITFSTQRGRSTGQQPRRNGGVLYCSARCSNTVQQRRTRKRNREQANESLETRS